MKKIILGIVIGIVSILGIKVYAESLDNQIQFLRSSFGVGYSTVDSFRDIKTGVVCYSVNGGNGATAISCVKE